MRRPQVIVFAPIDWWWTSFCIIHYWVLFIILYINVDWLLRENYFFTNKKFLLRLVCFCRLSFLISDHPIQKDVIKLFLNIFFYFLEYMYIYIYGYLINFYLIIKQRKFCFFLFITMTMKKKKIEIRQK